MKKGKSILPIGLFLILGVLLGLALGKLSDMLFQDNLWMLMLMLAFFLLGYFLHIILHEAGHWFFGMLTGYRMVMFRIGSLTLVRKDGKLTVKKYKIPGTAGQCLMAPPDCRPEELPYLWYNLGGGLSDLIFALIGTVLFLLTWRTHPVFAAFNIMQAVGGVLMAAANLIPMQPNGISNDGNNARVLSKSAESRRAFWVQLATVAHVVQGENYRELPEEWFELPAQPDFSDPLIAAIGGIKLGILMENDDFDTARALADQMLAERKLLGLFQMETACERMYLAAVAGEDGWQNWNQGAVRKYIAQTQEQISRQHLFYAIALAGKDDAAAQKVLEKFERIALTHPMEGEIKTERRMLALTERHMKNQQD